MGAELKELADEVGEGALDLSEIDWSLLTAEKAPHPEGPAREKSYLERATGIEPVALCLGSRCSTTELRPLRVGPTGALAYTILGIT